MNKLNLQNLSLRENQNTLRQRPRFLPQEQERSSENDDSYFNKIDFGFERQNPQNGRNLPGNAVNDHWTPSQGNGHGKFRQNTNSFSLLGDIKNISSSLSSTDMLSNLKTTATTNGLKLDAMPPSPSDQRERTSPIKPVKRLKLFEPNLRKDVEIERNPSNPELGQGFDKDRQKVQNLQKAKEIEN